MEVHAKKSYKYSTTGSAARASKYVGEYKRRKKKEKEKKHKFLNLIQIIKKRENPETKSIFASNRTFTRRLGSHLTVIFQTTKMTNMEEKLGNIATAPFEDVNTSEP